MAHLLPGKRINAKNVRKRRRLCLCGSAFAPKYAKNYPQREKCINIRLKMPENARKYCNFWLFETKYKHRVECF